MGAVKRLRLLLGALALVLVAAACGSEALEDSAAPAEGTSAPVVADDATDAADVAEDAQDAEDTAESDVDAVEEPAESEEPAPETTTTTTTEAPAVEQQSFGPVSLTPACTNLPDVSVGLSTEVLTSGGNEYNYQFTVPSSYDGSPLPVVLDFHGIGSNGAQQAVFSGWSAAAESEACLLYTSPSPRDRG